MARVPYACMLQPSNLHHQKTNTCGIWLPPHLYQCRASMLWCAVYLWLQFGYWLLLITHSLSHRDTLAAGDAGAKPQMRLTRLPTGLRTLVPRLLGGKKEIKTACRLLKRSFHAPIAKWNHDYVNEAFIIWVLWLSQCRDPGTLASSITRAARTTPAMMRGSRQTRPSVLHQLVLG